MSYRDFTFPDVVQQLGLRCDSTRLHTKVAPVAPSADLVARLRDGSEMAGGSNTAKARSEFVTAPVLLECYRRSSRRFVPRAGARLDCDTSAGLFGECGFLVSRDSVVTAVIETENGSSTHRYGPCIAAMHAAHRLNANSAPVHGVVTTGSEWRFMRLAGDELTLDEDLYFLPDVGKILAILIHMAETA